MCDCEMQQTSLVLLAKNNLMNLQYILTLDAVDQQNNKVHMKLGNLTSILVVVRPSSTVHSAIILLSANF